MTLDFKHLAGAARIAALNTPALAADANHGELLAKQWCASCHIVATDQRHGGDNVPTFASIARMPGFDTRQLVYFLLDPHPKMPNMSLSRAEAADLATYIASLGRGPWHDEQPSPSRNRALGLALLCDGQLDIGVSTPASCPMPAERPRLPRK